MQYTYLLKGLDCPHCAGKIEQAVGKLQGVESASINLMQQTLTLEAAESSRLDALVTRIVHSFEPDVQVSPIKAGHHAHEGHCYSHDSCGCHDHGHDHPHKHSHEHEHNHEHDHSHDSGKQMILRLVIGGILFAAALLLSHLTILPQGIILGLLIVSYVILGADVVLGALRNIIKGRVFDEHFLMSLASIGAFCIGEHHEAVAVMLFYQIGEYFQSQAVKRSRRSISQLMDLRPDSASVYRNGCFVTVHPETISVGETIQVKPGEKIPLDGIVLDGTAMLDTRALTGESVPRTVCPGDTALSGCINTDGSLRIQVTKPFAESTASKILALVENASSRKAPAENFITVFARYYTPVVVILAALIAVVPSLILGNWAEWIHRGFVFLVISCPCALVISIPLTFFGGIGAASRHGILVKGSNYLDALNHVKTVVFDKTGTLTIGVFQVTQIHCAPGFTPDQVLEYAAEAEHLSSHPIAKSILAAYEKPINPDQIQDYHQIPGLGIQAAVAGKQILAGSSKLLAQQKILFTPMTDAGTKVYLAIDGQYAGCILISDQCKPDAAEAIARLKALGISRTVMLTGDDESIAREVSRELGLDAYHAQLLPDQKVEILEQLDAAKPFGSKLAFVGDGINDAPVLARADVGIAMGALGSDAAIEAADVVLMTDEPGKLAEAMEIARATRKIVVQNIVFALAIKGLFLLLGAVGIAGMWEAVFADVGVALIAVLNAMRMLKK